MKKALFTLLLIAATCSAALAQNNSGRVLVSTDTVACESFVWDANGQTYTNDTADLFVNATNDTLFVLNLTIVHNANINEVAAPNKCTYLWHGTTYTTSGTYHDTIPGVAGCDSIFSLDLTLSSSETDSLVANACGEYIWNNDTLTTSGVYSNTTTDTVTNCTINTILTLTITSQLDRYDTVSNCGNYSWHDSTYTVGGDFTYLFADTVNLCDTLFHLNLDIVMDEVATVQDSACDRRIWYGDTLRTSNIYFHYDTNATTNCITKRTLDLTIKPFRTPVKDTIMSGCNSIRFTVSSLSGSTTRVFTQNADFDTNVFTRNWVQCYDSTIHLHVTIRHSSSSDTIVSACDSFYWDRTGKTYKKDNEVKFTLPVKNIEDCDSILNMILTVKSSPVIDAIYGEWNLAEGETARLYPSATEGSTYSWSTTPNMPFTTEEDTIVIPNVQGNFDVQLVASLNYSDANIVCHDTSWISIVTFVGIPGTDAATVSLYPNPVVGQLNIECAQALREVSVFNAIGQQVLNTQNLGTKNLLNLTTLSRGTYTMRITLANGETVVRKFVITK